MENETSFDLNQQIQVWRENLGQSPAFCGENLDELETHLRDSISLLEARGLSAEEAFSVAARRMGTSGSLAAEFGKVHRQAVWMDRIFWMLVGLQLWGLVHSVFQGLGSATSMAALSRWGALKNVSPEHEAGPFPYFLPIPVLAFTFVQLLVLAGSLAFIWWLIIRKGEFWGGYFGRLLAKRVHLVTGLIFLAILLVKSLQVVPRLLVLKALKVNIGTAMTMSQSYSEVLISILQTAALLIITIMLARKRMKSQSQVRVA